MNTLAYSEKAKGWVSFYSYNPDLFLRLNKNMFTIKNGQLWQHNDKNNPIRNNFYDEQYNSSITTIINEANAEDKIFKTLVLESNKKWDAKLKTNYTECEIKKDNFNTRESRHFAHTRGNELNTLQGNASQGIGNISSVASNTITFDLIPDLISIGDILFQLNGSNQEEIGVITNFTQTTITVDTIATPIIIGAYSFIKKVARIEGEEIRGYYMEVELTNEDTDATELFAIATNAVKSHV